MARTSSPTRTRGCQLGPQPAHPAGLAEGHEVLGQPRDGLERGERAVGEALGQAALLHEGVGQVRGVGDPAPRDADGDDRHDAQAEGQAGRQRRLGEPDRAERQDDRRGRVGVGRGEEGVEEADREGGEPERRQPAGEVGGRDAAEGEGGGERDRGDEDAAVAGRSSWRGPASQASATARVASGLARPSGLVATRSARVGIAITARLRDPPRSGRPGRGGTTRPPRSAAKRRSWVAATTAVPASTRPRRSARRPS